ncbi:6-phospho 3-hexuloisomerase [Lentibacillus populi]|uniref:6-phospho 3-hexuloisomerase n=1 Tax=Lentibacillus populi TaxID=1827502 RepID=A0A9W5TY33_9BACI|nr:6-phospho-3-hexuloisomerase [Lentibacillus populi]GGB45846.1 6-phospho 3-hexuloisomerase [Lentibacillus populi]
MRKIIETVTEEVAEVLKNLDESQVVVLGHQITSAKRIFVSGTGRSGLIGKVFAMRLMQSGYSVYVVGETITPSIGKEDLLIIISGSGSTGSLVQFAEKAKDVGTDLALVTTNRDSKIGQLSNCTVFIPAATKKRESHEPGTIQPLGSQFDQSAHLLLDALMVHLLQAKSDESDNTNLNKRHANLE